MALTDEDLQAIVKVLEPAFRRVDDRLDKMDARLDEMDARLDKMDARLDEMDARLDKMDDRLDKVDARLDKIENRLGILEVKQNRMSEQLTELQIAHKQFALNTNKKLNKLQDGIDSIEEILKINNLIPQ